jgi:hypothetical protein
MTHRPPPADDARSSATPSASDAADRPTSDAVFAPAVTDETLRRLLRAADPAQPPPSFSARLERRLTAERAPHGARRFGAALAFGVAFALAFVGGFLASGSIRGAQPAAVARDRALLAALEREAVAAGRSAPRVVAAPLSAARPLRLFAAAEAASAVIEGVAALELAGEAIVDFSPASERAPARFAVLSGRAAIVAEAEAIAEAGGRRAALHAGTVLEVAVTPRTEYAMKDRILAAAGGAALGAATVALLLKQGGAEVDGKKLEIGRPAAYAADAPADAPSDVVAALRADLAAARAALSAAQTRQGSLEKELATAKADAAVMRAFDAEKKAVEIGAVLARLDDLKKKGLNALVDPAATADVLSDLKALGPAGTKAMIDMLAHGDEQSRFFAARLLESLGDPAAIPALKDAAMKDESEMVTSQASHALALMKDPAVAEPCREIYETAKDGTGAKINALFGWARFGDERGVAEAVKYVTDSKVPAQFRAAIGQGFLLMADDKAGPVADAYVDANRKDDGIGMLAVQYYARIGSPAARDRLRSIADDSTVPDKVRKAANAELSK